MAAWNKFFANENFLLYIKGYSVRNLSSTELRKTCSTHLVTGQNLEGGLDLLSSVLSGALSDHEVEEVGESNSGTVFLNSRHVLHEGIQASLLILHSKENN